MSNQQRVPLVLALLLVASAALDFDLRAQGARLRVLFYGYVETKPRVAIGILDGNRVSDVTDVTFLRHGAEISPDGTLIAFDTCRKGDRSLHIARIDGSEERRVVELDGDSCVSVRWSRDGTRLLYDSSHDRLLHIVDLGSGVDTPLPYTGPIAGWASWSPAGDAIAYHVGKGGNRRIDVVDVATWKTRELIGKKQFGACEVWAPDWSPVGDRIAFTSCKRELYVVNVDGTGLSLLARSAYAPRWAPDGQSIFFLAGSSLMRIAASGGPVRPLGVSPYYGGPFSIGPAQ
jgi:Tol biopolymer transport system component